MLTIISQNLPFPVVNVQPYYGRIRFNFICICYWSQSLLFSLRLMGSTYSKQNGVVFFHFYCYSNGFGLPRSSNILRAILIVALVVKEEIMTSKESPLSLWAALTLLHVDPSTPRADFKCFFLVGYFYEVRSLIQHLFLLLYLPLSRQQP